MNAAEGKGISSPKAADIFRLPLICSTRSNFIGGVESGLKKHARRLRLIRDRALLCTPLLKSQQ